MENPVREADHKVWEAIIVGAGPIGIETAIALKQAGISYLHLEAGQIGHTISWWPRNTRFFSTPEKISLAGVPIPTIDQQQITGEAYLAYLRTVVEQFKLEIQTFEKVEQVLHGKEGFKVSTRTLFRENTYSCRNLVLATGGMARARKLGIPGEDLAHVSHYLVDPHTYFQKKLLVIGGRNSALEAAMRCWRAGADVTLSYRGRDFNRERTKNFLLDDIDTRVREAQIVCRMETIPTRIEPDQVILAQARNGLPIPGTETGIPVDFVLICIGYEADMSLFSMAGVELLGIQQAPQFNPDSMETNVAGLFVAGTAAGGTPSHNIHFIETSHSHIPGILKGISMRLGSA